MNTLPLCLVNRVLDRGGPWKGVWRCVCRTWMHLLQQYTRLYLPIYITSVALLQWARVNRCPLNEWTCSAAATNGHLEVLQWLRVNECCPWNEYTCSNAAHNGHLEMLQWARANGCRWSSMTCANAAHNGHLEVLQWARANGCPWNVNYCLGSRHTHVTDWIKSVI